MAKVMSFTKWLSQKQKQVWKTPEEAITSYIDKVLLAKRTYPQFYSGDQATDDVYAGLTSAMDGVAGTVNRSLEKAPPKKPPKPEKAAPGSGKKNVPTKTPWWRETRELVDKEDGSGTRTESGTQKGKTNTSGDAGAESSSGTTSATGGSTGGSTGVDVDDGDGGKGGGNKIAVKKKELEAFNNKAEFGDIDLRVRFQDMPKNPDLVMKEDSEKELKNDATVFGVVRIMGRMTMSDKNLAEFQSAENGTPWLGFVRIGRRVGLGEDRIVLIRLCETVSPGQKYAIGNRELAAGKSWHEKLLNSKFEDAKDPKIKSWNGWDLKALREDKTLSLSQTGSFYGFFLIKAADGGKRHYFNFRCGSLNRYANAVFSDVVPDLPRAKMNGMQHQTILNLTDAARASFAPDLAELAAHFPGIALKRGALALDSASKKLPMTWAKSVSDAFRKL